MNTDEFINLLSTGIPPAKEAPAARRFAVAIIVASIGSLILMLRVFGLRPDLSTASHSLLFWAKLAFPIIVGVGSLLAAARLSRPGAKVGAGWTVTTTPIALVWLSGLWIVATTASGSRLPAMLGHSWRSCPFNILLLSAPGIAAILWAVRGLAPTRLRLAGAISGLSASSIATVAYCLHCPEMNPAFWSIWYVLGMALPAVLGTLIGPKMLRW